MNILGGERSFLVGGREKRETDATAGKRKHNTIAIWGGNNAVIIMERS